MEKGIMRNIEYFKKKIMKTKKTWWSASATRDGNQKDDRRDEIMIIFKILIKENGISHSAIYLICVGISKWETSITIIYKV